MIRVQFSLPHLPPMNFATYFSFYGTLRALKTDMGELIKSFGVLGLVVFTSIGFYIINFLKTELNRKYLVNKIAIIHPPLTSAESIFFKKKKI